MHCAWGKVEPLCPLGTAAVSITIAATSGVWVFV
eukprot:SAG11_NODE_20448_length_445_cov_0.543353_2_plen_33_part_01